MSKPDTDHILNLVYNSAVLSAITVGYAFVSKKVFKMRLDSLDSMKIEDILKLSALISAGNYTAEMLYDKNIIPRNPFKN